MRQYYVYENVYKKKGSQAKNEGFFWEISFSSKLTKDLRIKTVVCSGEASPAE